MDTEVEIPLSSRKDKLSEKAQKETVISEGSDLAPKKSERKSVPLKGKVNSSEKKAEMRCMFSRGFLERRDLEQYFWTDKCVNGILNGIKSTFGPEESCCLCTPTIAESWWVEGEEVSLLDIDERFAFLPKFRYFDLRYPEESCLGEDQDNWRIIVFDPPFFYISMEVLFKAVEYICNGNFAKTKLLIGFLKREEKHLLEVFKEFNLKRTNFPLEYEHVKKNKWVNYALYSNVDIPGIKRLK